jgi:threonine/homoserine/homoserine lactone efflux protein
MLPDNLPAFLLVTTLSSFIPGPAVIFVMSQAAWRGARAGAMAGLGIQTSNAVYFLLSGLGLAGVIAASGTAFMVIKWLGAAYLLWLGVVAIRQSFRKDIAATLPVGKQSLNGYRDGMLVGFGNPKSILYFVALLPQFIDPSGPVMQQTVVLGAIAICIDFAADLAYAFAGGALSRTLNRPSIRRWFERGIGGIFVALSATAALYRRAA